MDVGKLVDEWKRDPEFVRRVGMVLTHQGIVRGTARGSGRTVTGIEVTPDLERIEELRREYEAQPGICRVAVEPHGGLLKPGDDLLFIVVAGDIRENVKPVLAELLDRIKSEAVTKKEALGGE